MSAIRLTYLYCDGGEVCPRGDSNGSGVPLKVDPLPYESARVQRQQARQAGWLTVGAKDFCPECRNRLYPEGARRSSSTRTPNR